MIFTTAFVVRYGRILGIVGVLAIAAWAINSKANGALANAERRGFERCQSQVTAAAAEADRATLEREAGHREVSRVTDIHWQEVQRDLQSRVDELTAARSIDLGRLRQCAAGVGRADSPAESAAAASEPDGRARDRGHDLQAQSDLGLELVRYAGECERYRRQVRELLIWVERARDSGP